VVLLILVAVWAVVLGPSLLRKSAQRRSTDSIGAFHRQLRVLQRTGPVLVDPVHRLDTTLPSAHVARGPAHSGHPGLIVVRPDSALPFHPRHSRSEARRPDPYFRPEACKRRRDVMVGLVGALVFTGLLGAVPQARPALFVTGFCALALVAYVVLLVQMRNRALERQLKLRYLPQRTDDEPVVARRVAAR